MSELIKVAAINDISGSSRCSITVALPILSAFGLQCCVLPTAVLSNHTGYEKYFFDDYTDKMDNFTDKWKEQGLKFGCIYSGFLGSREQIDITRRFFDTFRDDTTKILVDPVMGDDGEIYLTYTPELCEEMKELVCCADVVTPNVTEACILSGIKYTGEEVTPAQAQQMADKIYSLGAKNIIITGVKRGEKSGNYLFGDEGETEFFSRTSPLRYTGTGDVFASIICGFLARGKDLKEGVKFAEKFIAKAVEFSYNNSVTSLEGVCFEKFLKDICELN